VTAGHAPAEAPEAQLPADPEAYDSPRATQARARGLSAPYIAGGDDPEPEVGRSEQRRYLRILVAMIVIVVLAPFVLGVIANALGFSFLLGNP
jgi:hypothetical protein